MARLRDTLMTFAATSILAACGSGGGGTGGNGGHGGTTNTGGSGGHGGTTPMCTDAGAGTGKNVPHVIVVVQENHTFDAYFGKYCTAAAGSNPTCTSGPACCEAAPATEPGGASPLTLDDTTNGAYDPDHTFQCEVAEVHGGAMDRFVTNTDPAAPSGCADARNFALAGDAAKPYRDLAANGALADRYFQSLAGQSISNDMYFAVAKEVFIDNVAIPDAPGKECNIVMNAMSYTGTTIADLLQQAGKKVHWYSEGYKKMVDGLPDCPNAPIDCPAKLPVYPCAYDVGDNPFLFYKQHADDPTFVKDFAEMATDLSGGTLPEVAFVKPLGYKTEHPGYGTTISAGAKFVTDLVNAVEASCYKDSTLILVTWDEGGGYFDHVAPPPVSTVDNQPYGTRVPLIAIGPYAKKGEISHVEMEHSSIVKFLEWNFLDGKTGQLMARDAKVNNIGSLLDPAKVGATIPDM